METKTNSKMSQNSVKIGGSFTLKLGKGMTVTSRNEMREETYQVESVKGDEIKAFLIYTNIFMINETAKQPPSKTFSLIQLLDLKKTDQVNLYRFFEEEIEEVNAEEVDPDQLDLFKKAEEVKKEAEEKLNFNLDGMSKKEIKSFANDLLKYVKNDEVSAVKIFAKVNRVEALCKALKSDVLKKKTIEEIESGSNSSDSMSFSVYNTATKLTFDHFSGWSDLQDQAEPLEKALKMIKEKQKIIEDRMTQAFKNGSSLLDEDSGEITPPAKYSKGGGQAIRTTF